MPRINPQWIDSDLTPPADVEHPGYLGDGDTREFELYGADSSRLIPRSEWPALIRHTNESLRQLVRVVKNQGGNGSCVGASTVAAMQIAAAYQFGFRHHVELAIMSIYKAIGRSPGSGAMIADGMRRGRDVGALPLATEANARQFDGHVMTDRDFWQRYPDGFETTARWFRVQKWLKVQGADEFISAALRGKPVLYGRNRHAICLWLPVEDNSRIYGGYVNSWAGWGDPINDRCPHGLGYDSLRTLDRCVGYAAETMVLNPISQLPEVQSS